MPRIPPSRRWQWSCLALLSPLMAGQVGAQGMVVFPNCIQPGDTIRVKSGGWPNAYLYSLARNPCSPSEPGCTSCFAVGNPGQTLWTFQDGGKAFIYRDEAFWATENRIGDYQLRVYQGSCATLGSRCVGVPFRIVASVGDPWQRPIAPCSSPGTARCFPTLRVTFDPSRYCITSACRKIRIIQAYTTIGQCASGCPRHLTSAEQGLTDGASRDATTVGDWTIDAQGDDPSTPTDEADRDPNMNGNDPADIQFSGHKVGQQGAVAESSFVRDSPRTSVPELPLDITHFSGTFELNAFCSDGLIQGEWLGKVVWQWEKDRGGPATITVTSVSRGRPSVEFIGALQGWSQAREFDLPRDDKIPTTGGATCTP